MDKVMTRSKINEFKKDREALRLEYGQKIEAVNVAYEHGEITAEVHHTQFDQLMTEFLKKLHERLEQLKRDCPEISKDTTSDNI